jgi:hypothetical protein
MASAEPIRGDLGQFFPSSTPFSPTTASKTPSRSPFRSSSFPWRSSSATSIGVVIPRGCLVSTSVVKVGEASRGLQIHVKELENNNKRQRQRCACSLNNCNGGPVSALRAGRLRHLAGLTIHLGHTGASNIYLTGASHRCRWRWAARDLSTGCARRSPIAALKDGGSIPPTSTVSVVEQARQGGPTWTWQFLRNTANVG